MAKSCNRTNNFCSNKLTFEDQRDLDNDPLCWILQYGIWNVGCYWTLDGIWNL